MKITSLQNPSLKAAVALREAKARLKTQSFLVEGVREIARALKHGFVAKQVFYCPPFLTEEAQLVLSQAQAGTQACELDEKCFNKLVVRAGSGGLCVVFAAKPALSLAEFVARRARTFKAASPLLLLALEGVEKPGNFGAILRSADGAGADGVVVLGERLDAYHPHAIRASLGAVFAQTLVVATNAEFLAFCQEQGIKLISAMVKPESEHHFKHDLRQDCALLMGSEAYGLSGFWQAHSDGYAYIPMLGVADSLNVAAAAAVLLYEARRQRLDG